MVEFNPSHEIREGVDVVWQIPPNPKAVLYLAHSLNGSPFSYWPSHANVPQCTGTPEHKVVTKDALERGFAVIAGTSVTNEWETWPPSNVDIQNAVKILTAWTREHGLEDLPLSAWGTSCGGDYVSALATAVKMHSLIVMISHGHPEAFKAAVPGEYPATLFVPMINDEKTFSLVKENSGILRGKGIPCAIQEAPPLKVHPHFLAENIDELDKDQSAKLHSLFVEHGIVAEDNSLRRVLLKHEVEPYLRKTGILPTEDDLQRQKDEEKLEVQAAGGLKQGGGRGPGGPPQAGGRGGPPGGRRGGVGGPPSVRGEAPPAGGRGQPPSLRGEAPAAGGRGQPPSLRGESPPHAGGHPGGGPGGVGGPPSVRGEAPPAGGRGQPPSLRGEAPAAAGRGQPPSLRGESPPAGGRGQPPSLRGEAPAAAGRGQPPSLRGESPPAGGRGGGRGGGGPKQGGGGPPPSHPLANGISNQLMVAQGNHTLTARHNTEVFAWLEGRGWPNSQPQ